MSIFLDKWPGSRYSSYILASPGIGKLANLIVNTVHTRETIVTLIIIHKLDHSPQ